MTLHLLIAEGDRANLLVYYRTLDKQIILERAQNLLQNALLNFTFKSTTNNHKVSLFNPNLRAGCPVYWT